MPIDVVPGQSNSGGFNATGTQTATLPGGVTDGNTVILRVFTYGGLGLSTPSGFVRDSSTAATTQKGYIYRRGPLEGLAAAESSWNITGIAQPVAWWIDEYQGIDGDITPVDVAGPWTTATAATASTGTTGATTTYDGVALALHGARDAASGTGPTWSGHTNGFVEQGESAQAIAGGASSVGMSVSSLPVQSLGGWETTATHSLSPTTAPVGATIVVYSAAGAKRQANLTAHTGFEYGTIAGATTGLGAGSLLFDATAGTPAVVATSPRTGAYCLELSSTAAAEWVQWDAATFGTTQIVVARVSVRFPTSLPSGDVDLLVAFSTVNAALRYRTATQQLGIQIGGGTEQLSVATVAADTWHDVDVRFNASGTTWKADWQLDGVDQTQATLGGQTAGNVADISLGWASATTATVRYDDLAVSINPGNYPIGDIRVVLLKVDPAATPSVSGTVGNFGVMTANGTVVALTTPTLGDARDAVDDWPPTIGASADAAVANASSATDYIEFPMETYNASGTASIRAVRVLLAMWAASATAATCRVLGYDGTTATTLFAEADPNADNSTTTPAWIAEQWNPAGGWTQAKLDAATIRFGAADASPKLGPHAVGMEVAIQGGATQPHFGDLVTSTRDPVSGGILNIAATPTSGYDATLHYEEGGTPTDVPTPGGVTTTEVVNAPDAPSVEYVALYPPAEDISDA